MNEKIYFKHKILLYLKSNIKIPLNKKKPCKIYLKKNGQKIL